MTLMDIYYAGFLGGFCGTVGGWALLHIALPALDDWWHRWMA